MALQPRCRNARRSCRKALPGGGHARTEAQRKYGGRQNASVGYTQGTRKARAQGTNAVARAGANTHQTSLREINRSAGAAEPPRSVAAPERSELMVRTGKRHGSES